MPITREFTTAELESLGLPPDSPDEGDWPQCVLAVETIDRLKYSLHRRVIFECDGEVWAVDYEDATGSEADGQPEDHGWYEGTVQAVAVQPMPGMVTKWVPVGEGTGADA